MAGPSNLKTLNSIHISPNIIKPQSPSTPSSSSITNSMKLKTLLQTFVFSHVYRVARALTRAKSVIIELLRHMHYIRILELSRKKRSKKSGQKKLFFGSFRLHYNWCSSDSSSYVCYDSSWNSGFQKMTRVGPDFDEVRLESMNSELSKYLQWLEEKGCGGYDGDGDEGIEIDKLADLFIANCHEKFRLEKQESYRRFQEMMARSV
ncbi:septation ring formation regulator EzrA [Striga asiatica]|uniref:Septation ring formation regulator EzrA n=1 Tax=Striga asiatica TaxID=4170 RepID=A0A5A7QPF1_STRAF|nr:septation ring formation regulator EzrA [Striga asiatica]